MVIPSLNTSGTMDREKRIIHKFRGFSAYLNIHHEKSVNDISQSQFKPTIKFKYTQSFVQS
jgi:hypothetical protein